MKEMIEHQPVLLEESMRFLQVHPGGIYLDATVGLGGHSYEMLIRSSPDGKVVGIDRDPQALEMAAERLRSFGNRFSSVHGNYAGYCDDTSGEKGGFNGVLIDLGVSSFQLMEPSRGFSFQREGPLDMRMDPTQGQTAFDYLRKVSPEELEERLNDAGEVRFAKKLVPFLLKGIDHWQNTKDLANAISKVLPRRGKSHPATRVFLALRMAVNQELEGLRKFLEHVPDLLKPGGRLVIISFHSTEDRLAKRFFSDVWKTMSVMKRVTKSPVIPGWEERKKNARSRSAKMRVYEKQ